MAQQSARIFRPSRIILVIAAAIAVLAITAALTHKSGSTGGTNETASVNDAPLSLEALEKAARAEPGDAATWRRLGAAYYDASRYAEAADAYAKATGIDPTKPGTWSALGEARVMASEHDPMPADAVSAFRKAVELDLTDPRARYFLAVKRDLFGDHEGAITDWLALLADTPANAPWRVDLVRTIEQVGKINTIDVADRLAKAGAKAPPAAPAPALATQGIPGPSSQDLANASRLPPSQQRQMAEGMVARLEDKLKADPANAEGWVMLMRSRMALNEPAKAAGALADAVAANPGKAEYLRNQARMLGVQ
ncbi:tetratricopeptide repeat protein [Novosphingobium mangrovi (ex Huang et al. 2023)]|uniref:Tetratricopeptide repeat protein n=1 Tax=Novosphingobium mangrovi (ex Huang et al. 2023) TaxID=2976432 RepID=A0ABT2I9P2_9SPHN|nr:tetratricopeptide repeat protein [Novosphingobium mangrovi (ex Huang et al. 2023)]MCT2401543.1 tetratricopeptide repeat protein [Novosphingobium mangrovi (ex Huang et al. 2023)]